MGPDTVIAGRFRIIAQIGAGGMGDVYRAHDKRLGRDVAIKVLPASVAADPERLQRFEQEARATAALNHANVMAVHDAGEHEGAPYLVTELLEGESLRVRLRTGSMKVSTVARIALQITRGLAAAHAKGVVHRDLKPENLFITADGTVKILDFGLARLILPEGDTLETLSADPAVTHAGTVLGTVGYMAPEQARGEPADARADIFAFGCVLYEMLARRRPFTGESTAEVLSAILRDDPPPLPEVAPDLPPALVRVVERCLEKRPEERFSSAHDLALALDAAVSGIGAAPSGILAAPARRRWPLLVGGAVVAIAIAGAAVILLRSAHPDEHLSAKLNPARVLVVPFENLTGQSSLDSLGRLAAEAIDDRLPEIAGVELVHTDRIPSHGGEADLTAWRDLARARGAGTIVVGSYSLAGDALEIRSRILDTQTNDVAFSLDSDRGPRSEPSSAIDGTRQRVMGAVAYRLDRSLAGKLGRPIRYEAFREYQAARAASGLDYHAAIRHLRRVIKLEPDCWTAHADLLMAYFETRQTAEEEAELALIRSNSARLAPIDALQLRAYEARRAGNRVEALDVARQIHAMAPHDFPASFSAAKLAADLNRPREALQLIDAAHLDWAQVAAWRQGAWAIMIVALSHHYLGEYEAELRVAELALRYYPASHYSRQHQVRALAALGRLDDLDTAIKASLTVPVGLGSPGTVMLEAAEELRAHGRPGEAIATAERGARWFETRTPAETGPQEEGPTHAELLWVAGRWAEARRAAESWAAAHQDDFQGRAVVGIIAARVGDRATAAAVDGELAAVSEPIASGFARFYRAAIAAQSGEKAQAVELLRDGFAHGLRFVPELHRYVFLEPLHGYPPFEELVSPKG